MWRHILVSRRKEIKMYKHILLPTDGSALSKNAIRSCILYAKNVSATVTGVHVVSVPHEDRLEAWAHHDVSYAVRRQALFEKFANEYLAYIANSALAEDVPCTCRLVYGNAPHMAIIKTAAQDRCDLIFMASHGWKGETPQLLGSETLKVLIHSRLPVLVHKLSEQHRDLFRSEAIGDRTIAHGKFLGN